MDDLIHLKNKHEHRADVYSYHQVDLELAK